MNAADRGVAVANLVLAGVLTGNELGGWAAVHPALDGLPGRTRLPAEQAVYRRYGKIMPFLITGFALTAAAAVAE